MNWKMSNLLTYQALQNDFADQMAIQQLDVCWKHTEIILNESVKTL